MYQDFFQLELLPFSLTPNTSFFCELKGHQEALNTLKFCINSGEGFIKIVGEVGSGKTLLCRKLIESLDDNYITAYIPNPELNSVELRKAFARELGINTDQLQDQHELLSTINHHLIDLHASNKKVVLLIDESQALTDEALETIRLLTNLETKSTKLLQVVLFGQPELDERLLQPHLRQLKQRITFSYNLPPLSKDEIDFYLYHRLAVAGYTRSSLFTKKARKLLYKTSQGIPRLINILAHKALLVAYGKGEHTISHHAMLRAIHDTESIRPRKLTTTSIISLFAITMIILSLLVYLSGGI